MKKKQKDKLRKVAAGLGLAIFIYLVVGLFVEIVYGVGGLLSIFGAVPESVTVTCVLFFAVALLIGIVIWKKFRL